MNKKTAVVSAAAWTAIVIGMLSATGLSQAVADSPWDAPCNKTHSCLINNDLSTALAYGDQDPEEGDDDSPWD